MPSEIDFLDTLPQIINRYDIEIFKIILTHSSRFLRSWTQGHHFVAHIDATNLLDLGRLQELEEDIEKIFLQELPDMVSYGASKTVTIGLYGFLDYPDAIIECMQKVNAPFKTMEIGGGAIAPRYHPNILKIAQQPNTIDFLSLNCDTPTCNDVSVEYNVSHLLELIRSISKETTFLNLNISSKDIFLQIDELSISVPNHMQGVFLNLSSWSLQNEYVPIYERLLPPLNATKEFFRSITAPVKMISCPFMPRANVYGENNSYPLSDFLIENLDTLFLNYDGLINLSLIKPRAKLLADTIKTLVVDISYKHPYSVELQSMNLRSHIQTSR